MIRLATRISLSLALLIAPACVANAPATQPVNSVIPIESDLAEYQPLPTLEGTISSQGASITATLISAWAEEFKKIYPKIEFDPKGGRSIAAAQAMVGKSPPTLAAFNRAMTADEAAAFKQKFGYEPTAIRVAVNAIGVFVNADNLCSGLTFAQLDAIFSRTCKCGHKPILTWGDTGLRGDWAKEPILVYNLDATRGEYATFKSRVLLGGEFRFDAQTELTQSAIVQDVAVDRGGIGYASIIYQTNRSRALAIEGSDGTFYEPTYDNCVTQKYPLADFLYIYINKPPNRPLDRPTREFLAFVCSHRGQDIAARGGNFPLTAKLAREQLDLLGK